LPVAQRAGPSGMKKDVAYTVKHIQKGLVLLAQGRDPQ